MGCDTGLVPLVRNKRDKCSQNPISDAAGWQKGGCWGGCKWFAQQDRQDSESLCRPSRRGHAGSCGAQGEGSTASPKPEKGIPWATLCHWVRANLMKDWKQSYTQIVSIKWTEVGWILMNSHSSCIVEWKTMKALHMHAYVEPAKTKCDQSKKKQTYGQILSKRKA